MTLAKGQRVNHALVSILFIGEDVWMLEKSILMVQKISHIEKILCCIMSQDKRYVHAVFYINISTRFIDISLKTNIICFV